MLIELPCIPLHHQYHQQCATEWLRRQSTCPLCKQDIKHLLAPAAEANDSLVNNPLHGMAAGAVYGNHSSSSSSSSNLARAEAMLPGTTLRYNPDGADDVEEIISEPDLQVTEEVVSAPRSYSH